MFKAWPHKNNGRSQQVVFLVSGHYQRVSGEIQQEAGHGSDDRVAGETIVGEPAVVVDRLRGAQGVRRVPEDQRQNQHARRWTARVSIRVENNCYCIIQNDNASDWFENYCSILQQVVISI